MISSRGWVEGFRVSEPDLSTVPLHPTHHTNNVFQGYSCIGVNTSCYLSTNILDEEEGYDGVVECVMCLDHPAVYCARECGHLLFCESCVVQRNNIFCSGDVEGFCIICRREYPKDGGALIRLEDAAQQGIKVFVA